MTTAVTTPHLPDATGVDLEDWGALEEATGPAMQTRGGRCGRTATPRRGSGSARPAPRGGCSRPTRSSTWWPAG